LPGLAHLPIINKLFASNTTDVLQTDIVMLLTPRIVRTQEITASDLSPIFIGTQSNLGLGGPPPLIAPQPDAEPVAAAQPALAPNAVPPGAQPNPGGGVSIIPPGSSPFPGTTAVTAAPTPAAPNAPAAQPPAPAGLPLAQPAPAPAPVTPANAGAPPPTIAPAGAQIVVTPPGTDFRVGGGPYTVALSATNATRLSGLSLTITFNPSALRVRAVQEGSFMRAGGAQATFTQQVDAAAGRIDIAILRTGDATGVAGTGLLAAVLFDAVGGGSANLAISGTATAPGGASAVLQMIGPPAITVR
jgi:hypothetical protein